MTFDSTKTIRGTLSADKMTFSVVRSINAFSSSRTNIGFDNRFNRYFEIKVDDTRISVDSRLAIGICNDDVVLLPSGTTSLYPDDYKNKPIHYRGNGRVRYFQQGSNDPLETPIDSNAAYNTETYLGWLLIIKIKHYTTIRMTCLRARLI